MKKAMIALSAILVAAPVFAATTHATDDTRRGGECQRQHR